MVFIEMPWRSSRPKYWVNVVQSGGGPSPPFSRQAVARRRRRALSGDVERHALAHLALRGAVGHERHLGVRVEVDEPRCDDQARGIDDASRVLAAKLTNSRDAVATDADVGAHGCRAGSVQHLPTANE